MSGLDRSDGVNVGSWLRDRARLHPERIAVVQDGEERALGYGELNSLANRAASALRQRGIEGGDRVALALGSNPLYLALYFAAAKLGAILLPLNTRLTERELAFQIDDAEPRLVLRAASIAVPERAGSPVLDVDELCATLPEAAPEPALAPGGEAPQVLMYTSGTTGTPRGALLPHRKTLYNTLNAEAYLALGRDDRVIVPVPLFHSFGLKILSVPALFAGATVILVERFDPAGLQESVARHGATVLAAVPVMYRRMVAAGLSPELLRSLRYAFAAGAPTDLATIRAFDAVGLPLRQGYGQTETSILCCLDAKDALRKAGSVGRPVRHCELRIVDGEGKPVPAGTTGEVVVRGPILMLGYWRRPDDTRSARHGEWHRTGDLGVLDSEGYVTLVGRLKEMYISGGENVYPAEVERVIEEHPNVAEAAVVGVPDPEWGETGRAYVVPRREPLDVDELLTWLRGRLAGYKRPRRVEPVRALPRTPSGKVQKHRLAALPAR